MRPKLSPHAILDRELELLEAGDLERIDPPRGLQMAQTIVEPLVTLEQAEQMV